MVRSYLVSNPLRLTVLAAKSEDYTTAPEHLQVLLSELTQFTTKIVCDRSSFHCPWAIGEDRNQTFLADSYLWPKAENFQSLVFTNQSDGEQAKKAEKTSQDCF